MYHDFEYYKITENKAGKVKTVWVYSNLFVCDMLKRIYTGAEPVYTKNRSLVSMEFIIMKEGKIESVIQVKKLYPDEVKRAEDEKEVKNWKRVYKI
mgnify:CR=1 FL=1